MELMELPTRLSTFSVSVPNGGDSCDRDQATALLQSGDSRA